MSIAATTRKRCQLWATSDHASLARRRLGRGFGATVVRGSGMPSSSYSYRLLLLIRTLKKVGHLVLCGFGTMFGFLQRCCNRVSVHSKPIRFCRC